MADTAGFAANIRCTNGPQTGTARYANMLLARLPKFDELASEHWSSGLPGHVWEQLRLPMRIRNSLLWSPSNTGPLVTKHQVVTIHDVAPLDHPEWFSLRFAWWYRFLTPRLVRRVRRVIADSESTKQRILHHADVDPDKIVVIPCGVEDRFRPQSDNQVQIARDSAALPQGTYILSVSSLEPRKNLPRLLEAWRIVQDRFPEVTLVVAGAKGALRVFRDQELGVPSRTLFTGYIEDEHLPALYTGATAFVYPSLYEGFGLPPLEAMACGTPVLSSNTTSIPEVVGDAGLLVDPTDTQAIADGLVRLLTDEGLRQELSKKGLERSKQFTWEETAHQTWEILRAEAES